MILLKYEFLNITINFLCELFKFPTDSSSKSVFKRFHHAEEYILQSLLMLSYKIVIPGDMLSLIYIAHTCLYDFISFEQNFNPLGKGFLGRPNSPFAVI